MTIIDPRPCGVVDWTLSVAMLVLAVPVLIVFGWPVWIVRAYDRIVAGKAGA